MNVTKLQPQNRSKKPPMKEEEKLLKDLGVNDMFRFRSAKQSFDEALETHGQSFYRVIANVGPAKTGEVWCVSLDGKECRQFNDTHTVYQHKYEIKIAAANLVPVEQSEFIEDNSETA